MSQRPFRPALLAACLLPAGLAAQDVSLQDLAACEARYTAVVQHGWLMQEETTGAAALRRALFAAMAAALAEPAAGAPAPARAALAPKLAERRAMVSLLDASRFAPDARRRAIARGLVARRLRACDGLILPGARLAE